MLCESYFAHHRSGLRIQMRSIIQIARNSGWNEVRENKIEQMFFFNEVHFISGRLDSFSLWVNTFIFRSQMLPFGSRFARKSINKNEYLKNAGIFSARHHIGIPTLPYYTLLSV